MSDSPQTEPTLQPVHRIFLGELFVFVFFFAAVMSVLVGAMGRPLLYSALLVGAGALISGTTFFWFAFTTPSRSEPRYGFMVLSLLPTIAMSPVIVLIAHYASMEGNRQTFASAPVGPVTPAPPARDPRLLMLVIVSLSKHEKSLAEAQEFRMQAAQRQFAREIKDLEVELVGRGFTDKGVVKTQDPRAITKRFERNVNGEKDVAVETRLSVGDNAMIEYSAVITNSNPEGSEPYFDKGDKWAVKLQLELMKWCNDLGKPLPRDD